MSIAVLLYQRQQYRGFAVTVGLGRDPIAAGWFSFGRECNKTYNRLRLSSYIVGAVHGARGCSTRRRLWHAAAATGAGSGAAI